MASNRSLFDRLRNPEPVAARSVHDNTQRVADSVLEHLQRMMNARHGECPAAPTYGIPALEAEGISASDDMRQAIEDSIRKHEPRLSGVRVRHVPKDPDDPLKVRFEISARMATADERVSVRFDTEIDSRGEWKVRA